MRVWKDFHVHHVYRSDSIGALGNSLRWGASLILSQFGRSQAVSLLDNAPLVRLLEGHMAFDDIQGCIDAGVLDALAITASGYTSGQSVTFFQAVNGMEPWKRARRVGIPARIRLEHLLASTAIPFFFPAVKINREFFGDGSMRQIAPVSPALHLGAGRLLVVAAGRRGEELPQREKSEGYPSLAQIAGHALNSIFIGSTGVDLERLERINRTVRLIPDRTLDASGITLRPVEVLVITPSEAIEHIAERHAHALPRTIRFLFSAIGATAPAATCELSAVREVLLPGPHQAGLRDAMARKEEILRFIGHS